MFFNSNGTVIFYSKTGHATDAFVIRLEKVMEQEQRINCLGKILTELRMKLGFEAGLYFTLLGLQLYEETRIS